MCYGGECPTLLPEHVCQVGVATQVETVTELGQDVGAPQCDQVQQLVVGSDGRSLFSSKPVWSPGLHCPVTPPQAQEANWI